MRRQIFFLMLLFTLLVWISARGQTLNDDQKLSLLQQVDELIFDYQTQNPAFLGSDINQFNALFKDDASLENVLFPEFIPSSERFFCVKKRSTKNYFEIVSRFVKNNNGRYHKFQHDMAYFYTNKRIDFSNRRSFVDFDKSLSFKLAKGDSIYTTSKNRLWIGYDILGNDIGNVKIFSIERVEKPNHTLFKKRRKRLEVASGVYFPFASSISENAQEQNFQNVSVSNAVGFFSHLIVPLKYGLHIGAGLSYYQAKTEVRNYQTLVSTQDIDGDDYVRNITGVGITENLSLLLLNIPLQNKWVFPVKKDKFSIIVRVGVNVGIPLNFISSTKNSGTFTYRGYYPQYNWEAIDIAKLDFYENEEVRESLKPNLAPLLISSEMEAAIGWKDKNDFDHSLGISLRYLLNAMTRQNNSEVLSENRDQMNSLSQFIDYRYLAPGLTYTLQFPRIKKIVLTEKRCD